MTVILRSIPQRICDVASITLYFFNNQIQNSKFGSDSSRCFNYYNHQYLFYTMWYIRSLHAALYVITLHVWWY